MKKLLIIFCSVVLFGCASSLTSDMNELSVGMSKRAVVDKMGEPHRLSAKGEKEYMLYKLMHPVQAVGTPEEYFVLVIDGSVDSFGKIGEFDTKQVYEPSATVDIHLK